MAVWSLRHRQTGRFGTRYDRADWRLTARRTLTLAVGIEKGRRLLGRSRPPRCLGLWFCLVCAKEHCTRVLGDGRRAMTVMAGCKVGGRLRCRRASDDVSSVQYNGSWFRNGKVWA